MAEAVRPKPKSRRKVKSKEKQTKALLRDELEEETRVSKEPEHATLPNTSETEPTLTQTETVASEVCKETEVLDTGQKSLGTLPCDTTQQGQAVSAFDEGPQVQAVSVCDTGQLIEHVDTAQLSDTASEHQSQSVALSDTGEQGQTASPSFAYKEDSAVIQPVEDSTGKSSVTAAVLGRVGKISSEYTYRESTTTYTVEDVNSSNSGVEDESHLPVVYEHQTNSHDGDSACHSETVVEGHSEGETNVVSLSGESASTANHSTVRISGMPQQKVPVEMSIELSRTTSDEERPVTTPDKPGVEVSLYAVGEGAGEAMEHSYNTGPEQEQTESGVYSSISDTQTQVKEPVSRPTECKEVAAASHQDLDDSGVGAKDTEVKAVLRDNTCTDVKVVPMENIAELAPRVAHRKLYPRLEVVREAEVKPFTKEQLRSLYYNAELARNTQFVDNFLQQANKDKHEFYEKVLSYYRARNKLVAAEQDVEALRNKYEKYRELVWTSSSNTVMVQGICLDKTKVKEEHVFLKAQFDQGNCDDMAKILKDIRRSIHEGVSLYAYEAQLSKLQVESYIHDVYKSNPSLMNIPLNSPVQTGVEQRAPLLNQQVETLKTCISILFMFQRKPTKDDLFLRDTRQWLQRLVASLLRVAILEDHLFLLNHLLRCPPGVGKWGANFIQVCCPLVPLGTMGFGSDMLDHFITMMSTLLLPVRAREDFLYQLKAALSPAAEKCSESENPWILVDSDGEEDEDSSSQGWQYLTENDLVALLNQLPMAQVFRHVLLLQDSMDGYTYDIQWTNESSMLKLFAFATCLVRLLGYGLNTFSLGRYRQLNKRLGRLLRDTVYYVSDHWLNFKGAVPHMPWVTKQRLQIEFDQFFFRATQSILSAQRLGSWQFMADMPYTCVSMEMMWKLVWLMHYGYKDQEQEFTLTVSVDESRAMLNDEEKKQQFESKLLVMPTSEAIYLLTTFANMARSRPAAEQDFVEAITSEIYEIAYISSHTREFCSKVGRELLSSIASEHPFIISSLLQSARQSMEKVGMVSLYLFKDLPVQLWQPTESDWLSLREWLLERDLATAENQLARLVLEKMNWGYNRQAVELFLNLEVHRQMAVMLVEAHTKHISDKNVGGLFSDGLSQVASVVRSSMTNEQQFSNWAWQLALRLQLHACSQPQPVLGTPMSGLSVMEGIPNIHEDAGLHLVLKSMKEHGALASYVALMMTTIGHSIGDFCAEGLPLFSYLVSQQHFTAAIRVLYCITPMFYQHGDSLFKNEKFVNQLHNLLNADQSKMPKSLLSSEFPGTILHLFTAMIQTQVQKACIPGGAGGVTVLKYWLTAITSIPKWHHDRHLQYVIDILLKAGYRIQGAQDMLQTFFQDLYKGLLRSPKDQGVFSAFVSWLATGNSLPSYLDANACGEFSWFAYHVLLVENEFEEESQLWAAVQKELLSKPDVSVDQALKKAATSLKMEVSPSGSRLSIYRWANQALDMAPDHPLLPLVWQRFFLLYLGRYTSDSGLPERGGLGERFFTSFASVSMVNRMKRHLKEAADFHHQKADGLQVAPKLATETQTAGAPVGEGVSELDVSGEHDEDNAVIIHERAQYHATEAFHRQLVRFYQTLSFWLDEPRLHDPKLYLPALPPQYEADRLLTLFQNQKEPWSELVNTGLIDYELTQLTQDWSSHTAHKPRSRRISLQDQGPDTATERILERLKSHNSPAEPPSMVPLKAPVPEISPTLLTDQQTLLQLLRSDFHIIVDYALLFSERVSRHVGIDYTFIELVPLLFKNEMSEVVVTIPCKSTFNPTHRCSGPAHVTCRYEAMTRDELINRKIDENRVEYKQLMIESLLPPAQNVCSAAVHIENAIVCLIKMSKLNPTGMQAATEVGTALFYHLSTLVSDATKYYPPTRQFFSSCIEVLGQEFILGNPTQSQPLLQSILQTPILVGLLAPNFSPNACPDLFVTMYEDMIEVPVKQGPDLAFVLLTKFDVQQWLEVNKPVLSHRSALITVLGKALGLCGQKPDIKMMTVFEVYRAHLRFMLNFQFPDHFGDVLKLLLKGSSKEELNVECWYDFLKVLGYSPGSLPQPQGQTSTTAPPPSSTISLLSINDLKDSMQWLGSYFIRLRVSTTDSASFGLYPVWKPYVNGLANLLGMLACNCIAKTVASVRVGQTETETAVGTLWQEVIDLFSAWIHPLDNNGQILSPWIETDFEVASQMVSTFRQTVDYLLAQFKGILPTFSHDALTFLWPHYVKVLCKSGTPDHVLRVFHAQLVQLPWHNFHPDIPAMELMQQVHQYAPRTCFNFLGCIFPKMDWVQIVQHYCNHEVPEIVTRLHICLFRLLVQLAKEQSVMEGWLMHGRCLTQTSDMPQLLSRAESFDWNYLDCKSYDEVIDWFLHNCDPRCLLAERTAKSALVLRLLKVAAGFVVNPNTVFHPETPLKRVSYVRCVVQLLCQCSHLKEISPELFSLIVTNLMTEVEAVVGTVVDPESQRHETIILCKEVLNVLNNCNPHGRTTWVLQSTLLQWIQSSPNSLLLLPLITAASRTLASLTNMVLLIEECLDAHFNSSKDLGDSYKGGWDAILAELQVPEMSREEFLQEGVKQGCYLTLHAYVLQKLPMCQKLEDELYELTHIINWTSKAKPRSENEAKLLLWWAKVLDLVMRQLDFGAEHRQVSRTLLNFIPALMTLAEDKATSGLLGAIGLGKKSQLSHRFRLTARALATYLASQVTVNNALRLQPQDPGAVRDPFRAVSAGNKYSMPSQQATQLLASLEALRTNKAYADLREHINFAVEFTSNPGHCLRDSHQLLVQLVTVLFSDKTYLALLQPRM